MFPCFVCVCVFVNVSRTAADLGNEVHLTDPGKNPKEIKIAFKRLGSK